MALGRLVASVFWACILSGAATASEQGTLQAGAVPPQTEFPAGIPPPPPRPPLAAELLAPPGFAAEFERHLALDKKLSPAERRDREALKDFYAERRNEPVWVTATGFTPAAEAARAEMTRADDWGLEAANFKIPALHRGAELTRDERADAEIGLSLAILQYARHARGGRTEPVKLSRNLDREPPLLDPRDVIAAAAGTPAPDVYLRSLHPQHPQFVRLRQQYLALKQNGDPPEEEVVVGKGKSKKRVKVRKGPTLEKLLVNMEQWRWMPEDLGSYHVWVNIPEYMVRVMKDGREVHSERVVVGRASTPTPAFSDEMEHVIFHPFWNVPDSIKINELQPSLAAGDVSVLSRQGLKITYRGREVDAWSVDWDRADMRKYHVFQPPGRSNALGVVKFMFPNQHDVYLHDTPSKGLFNSGTRAFSHGCIRVRDPLKLAAVLLSEDRGWSAGQVAHTVKRGQQDNRIDLSTKVPVHITYFTVWVDDDGRVRTFGDVYQHEDRIALGVAGKAHLIKREPEVSPPTVQRRGAPRSRTAGSRSDRSSNSNRSRSYSSSDTDWMRRVFQY